MRLDRTINVLGVAAVACCVLGSACSAGVFEGTESSAIDNRGALQKLLQEVCVEYAIHQCTYSASLANDRFWRCRASPSSGEMREPEPANARAICDFTDVFKASAFRQDVDLFQTRLAHQTPAVLEPYLIAMAWMAATDKVVQLGIKHNNATKGNAELLQWIGKHSSANLNATFSAQWAEVSQHISLTQHAIVPQPEEANAGPYQASPEGLKAHMRSVGDLFAARWSTPETWLETVTAAGLASKVSQLTAEQLPDFFSVAGVAIALAIGNEATLGDTRDCDFTWFAQNDYTAKQTITEQEINVSALSLDGQSEWTEFQKELAFWYYNQASMELGSGQIPWMEQRRHEFKSCNEIFSMTDNPKVMALMNHGTVLNAQGEPYPVYAAFVFVCGDIDKEGNTRIVAKPEKIVLEAYAANAQTRVLLINASPHLNEDVGPFSIAVGMTTTSFNSTHRPLRELAISAFPEVGAVPSALDNAYNIIELEPGLINALWIDLSSVHSETLRNLDFTAAIYPYNVVTPLDTRPLATPWWQNSHAMFTIR